MENWKTTLMMEYHRKMHLAYENICMADEILLHAGEHDKRAARLAEALSWATSARDALVTGGLVPDWTQEHHYRKFTHAEPQHEEACNLVGVVLERQGREMEEVAVRGALLDEIPVLERRLAEVYKLLRTIEYMETDHPNTEDTDVDS